MHDPANNSSGDEQFKLEATTHQMMERIRFPYQVSLAEMRDFVNCVRVVIELIDTESEMINANLSAMSDDQHAWCTDRLDFIKHKREIFARRLETIAPLVAKYHEQLEAHVAKKLNLLTEAYDGS